jgi:hypothetical protein
MQPSISANMLPYEKSTSFISGNFPPDEAIDLLNSVFTGKIEFHRTRNLSAKERTGLPHPLSEERIRKLAKDRKELTDMIRSASGTCQEIRIESEIHIIIS